MSKYDSLCRKSKVNNLLFDILGDVGITLGFIPYLFFYLVLVQMVGPDTINSIDTLLQAFDHMGALALILFLITFIMTLKADNSCLKEGLYYGILGVVYYAVEITLYLVLNHSLERGSIDATDVFFDVMPNNYLLSVAAFIFLFYFVFASPKWCNSKKKLCLFRLGSIIPLAYIFLSYLFSVLFSFEIVTPPLLLYCLFSGQYFSQELMGLTMILALFILKKKEEKKKAVGKTDDAELGEEKTVWGVSDVPQSKQNIIVTCSVAFFS